MMKNFFKIFSLTIFASVLAHGQSQVQVKAGSGIDIKKIEIQAQLTPIFQAGGVKDKKFKPRDWLEVEVTFEAKDVAPRDAVVPELLFRYYIGMMDEEGKVVVMTTDITHLNVEAGEETFSAVYVSPSTLGKLTGDFRSFNPNVIKGVGVEVYYNGVLVGGGVELTSKKFWEGQNPTAGVLSRSETPFGILWIDRYADEKKK